MKVLTKLETIFGILKKHVLKVQVYFYFGKQQISVQHSRSTELFLMLASQYSAMIISSKVEGSQSFR